jgi:hypothetical protein
MNDEFERIWKEMSVACIEVLPRHVSGRTVEELTLVLKKYNLAKRTRFN